MAGVGLAYLLSSRRRVFHDRTEPEAYLGAPLLADIPDFAEEGLKTRLPVRESPRSAAAEAFRFATASLELKLARQQAKSLVVISATLGTGKSTVLPTWPWRRPAKATGCCSSMPTSGTRT